MKISASFPFAPLTKLCALVAALAGIGWSPTVEADYHVIPLPLEMKLSDEAPFELTPRTSISYPADNAPMQRNAEFLSEYIAQATGYALQTLPADKAPKKGIVLALDPAITQPEGYRMEVNSGGVKLSGSTPQGVFHALQPLRKSIPATATDTHILLPAVTIEDAPRFAYRGMHLDVCRHFFPIEFVKRYIDLLALHQMNTFHWHLTDDQGWRIESKRFPRLNEISSMRQRTVVGKAHSGEYDEPPYGGYYTQEQLRDVVEYAAQRYITVIPEVDLPGHMLAALAAYPELGCTGGPYEVCPDWGIFPDVLCIGNEQTFAFLEGVMDEVMDIFPSHYIHIGGDEAPRTRWHDCPKCQARIRTEHLQSDGKHSAEDRLQTYCMARVERYLNEHGRDIIGWDEILEGDVAPNATIMSWRGMQGGIKAARLGHDVIMTPTSYCYLDYYQSEDRDKEPLAIGGFVPVEKVYSLEPVPTELTSEEARHILGAQCNLWTEYIATTEHVEYMVLPRMAALSEVQWMQPEAKDYDSFLQRLPRLAEFYRRDGDNYAKHVLVEEK